MSKKLKWLIVVFTMIISLIGSLGFLGISITRLMDVMGIEIQGDDYLSLFDYLLYILDFYFYNIYLLVFLIFLKGKYIIIGVFMFLAILRLKHTINIRKIAFAMPIIFTFGHMFIFSRSRLENLSLSFTEWPFLINIADFIVTVLFAVNFVIAVILARDKIEPVEKIE